MRPRRIRFSRWLKQEINETWEKRTEIEPSYESAPKPKLLEILKLLPKTNCRACGEATCMVFAVRITKGVKGTGDCPMLSKELRIRLDDYLAPFAILE